MVQGLNPTCGLCSSSLSSCFLSCLTVLSNVAMGKKNNEIKWIELVFCQKNRWKWCNVSLNKHQGLSPQTQLEMSSALLKTGFDITKNGWKCQQILLKKDLVLLSLQCQEMSPGVLNYTQQCDGSSSRLLWCCHSLPLHLLLRQVANKHMIMWYAMFGTHVNSGVSVVCKNINC